MQDLWLLASTINATNIILIIMSILCLQNWQPWHFILRFQDFLRFIECWKDVSDHIMDLRYLLMSLIIMANGHVSPICYTKVGRDRGFKLRFYVFDVATIVFGWAKQGRRIWPYLRTKSHWGGREVGAICRSPRKRLVTQSLHNGTGASLMCYHLPLLFAKHVNE